VNTSATNSPLESGGVFGIIYADPPWRYDNGTPGREIERHYPTMSDEEICALKVPAAKDSILYLWATAPRLESGLAVMSAWGFRYKTQAVWDKVKVGMGFWFRGQHEILMVGTRGDVSPPPQPLRISSVIRCPRGRHSAKPDYVRDMIVKWFPDVPRLEMFSRLKRPGWEVFGNQVEHDLLSLIEEERSDCPHCTTGCKWCDAELSRIAEEDRLERRWSDY
jgi:N6-adenosine-specific RNA methylase IME4